MTRTSPGGLATDYHESRPRHEWVKRAGRMGRGGESSRPTPVRGLRSEGRRARVLTLKHLLSRDDSGATAARHAAPLTDHTLVRFPPRETALVVVFFVVLGLRGVADDL
jgi:hypothetical protein